MRKILALAFALAAGPALAADSLTITLVSDSPTWTGTASKTWTFTQGDMTKFLAWVNATYPCTPTPAVNPGDPPIPCTQLTPPALLLWAQGFLNGTKANVVNWQNNSAAATAVAGVTPINPQ
jgi:hypothetical protein